MELPFAIGQVIAHKYRVDRIIGQGAMGVVVAGFHLELEQLVAIKFLVSDAGLESEAAERFRREGRASARIQSQHVARVFDVGLLDERVPYLVMELLHGNDLGHELELRRALPVAEAVGYVLQAIDALAEAHATGIVHRDLKPTNLFLDQRADGSRQVKVLDFGISKSLGASGEIALTRTAAFVGSPWYMAPEQMRSARDVDARADVWALGAILYVMLTGQLPHPGSSLPDVCFAVMHTPPRSLTAFMTDVPPGLEAILIKCLAKEPSQRYATVAELATSLLPFAPEWQRVVARAQRLLAAAPLTGSDPPALARSSNPSSPAQNGGKNRRAAWIVGPLLALAGVLGLRLAATHRQSPPALAALPALAARPAVPVASTVPVAAAVPVASTVPVASAVPAVSVVPVAPAVSVVPVASAVPVAPRAPAPPSSARAETSERAHPPANESTPSDARYTDFGGRR